MNGTERGSSKHGPELDEEMKHETSGTVQGHGYPHAEPFRDTEPMPDDTDGPEVVEAFERGGSEGGPARE